MPIGNNAALTTFLKLTTLSGFSHFIQSGAEDSNINPTNKELTTEFMKVGKSNHSNIKRPPHKLESAGYRPTPPLTYVSWLSPSLSLQIPPQQSYATRTP